MKSSSINPGVHVNPSGGNEQLPSKKIKAITDALSSSGMSSISDLVARFNNPLSSNSSESVEPWRVTLMRTGVSSLDLNTYARYSELPTQNFQSVTSESTREVNTTEQTEKKVKTGKKGKKGRKGRKGSKVKLDAIEERLKLDKLDKLELRRNNIINRIDSESRLQRAFVKSQDGCNDSNFLQELGEIKVFLAQAQNFNTESLQEYEGILDQKEAEFEELRHAKVIKNQRFRGKKAQQNQRKAGGQGSVSSVQKTNRGRNLRTPGG